MCCSSVSQLLKSWASAHQKSLAWFESAVLPTGKSSLLVENDHKYCSTHHRNVVAFYSNVRGMVLQEGVVPRQRFFSKH